MKNSVMAAASAGVLCVSLIGLTPANAAPKAPVKVRSSLAFNGFGALQAAATADTADAYNPIGFGGQQGYYHDYAGLYVLMHLFYDVK